MNEKIKDAIVAGFEKIKDKEYVQSQQFHFTEGKAVLDNLKKDENKKEFQQLLDFINSNKKNKKEINSGWYRKIYPENGEPDRNSNHYKVCERINEFVAYCDTHAKGAGEKECIAKAGIRQNDWIKNVLQYLVNVQCGTEQDFYKGVTYGVKRAIEYFEKPTDNFPILSEKHQKLIAKYIGVSPDKFDQELKEAFDNILTAELLKSIDASVQVLDENCTFIYTNIIYDLKSEWEFFDTEFYTTNKNVILTGAPGTGKTYLAKKIAAKIVSPNDPIDVDTCSQIGFVQFHPSFDYTDFVEGLRPIQKGENVGFELKDGIFKKFCAKAGEDWYDIYNPKLEELRNKNEDKQATAENKKEAYNYAINESKKYVFIIDEINRGEISKIFGELFFSIDPGYRGKDGKVRTQYANMVTASNVFDKLLEETEYGHFFVPENVYIIGTMNDIDRSVESMDFAFRRRFAFKEVTADESKENILFYSDLGLSQENLRKLSNAMDAINEKLTELGLSDCYHIGAAYFLKIKNYSKSSKCDWNALWNYHLQGTLYEYYRGEPDADKKMAELKKAYDSALK